MAYISSKCGRGLLGQYLGVFFLFFDLAEAMQQRLSEYTRFKEEVFSLSLRGLVSTHETGVSCSAKASFS